MDDATRDTHSLDLSNDQIAAYDYGDRDNFRLRSAWLLDDDRIRVFDAENGKNRSARHRHTVLVVWHRPRFNSAAQRVFRALVIGQVRRSDWLISCLGRSRSSVGRPCKSESSPSFAALSLFAYIVGVALTKSPSELAQVSGRLVLRNIARKFVTRCGRPPTASRCQPVCSLRVQLSSRRASLTTFEVSPLTIKAGISAP